MRIDYPKSHNMVHFFLLNVFTAFNGTFIFLFVKKRISLQTDYLVNV